MRTEARKQSSNSYFKLLLVTLLIISAFVLTGCDPSDADFILEVGIEWAHSHGIVDEEGNVDNMKVLGRTFGRSTGDPVADTALDAGIAVKTQEEAEQLAQQGAETGNVGMIDAAIFMRPGDWSLQEQKGALLLASGDEAGAEAAFAESELLVQQRLNAGGECKFFALSMMRHREAALITQINRELDPPPILAERLRRVQNEITMLEMDNPLSMCR